MRSGLIFRRLARADFPLLQRWLVEPHVARWWNHETEADAIEADFGPSVDGVDPTDVFVVWAAEQPLGLLQRYRFADNPDYVAELAGLVGVPPNALSIDYLVGTPALLARGWGSAMIGDAVAAIWRDHPLAEAVIVPVHADNVASWRALQRAGFARVASGSLAPDNAIDDDRHHVYLFERPR